MSYCVLDFECDGKKTYRRFCNQFDSHHRVVLSATYYNDEVLSFHEKDTDPIKGIKTTLEHNDVRLVVGANIKFDLLWIWKYSWFRELLKKGLTVWDTQTVEYLLHGQDPFLVGNLNLDALAKKYKGTLKDDRVGIMFKEGALASEIDPDILIPYCENDVRNTNLVFLAQVKQVQEKNMMPLIKAYMLHYLALCEIEYNGLFIDTKGAFDYAHKLQEELTSLKEQISALVKSSNRWPTELEYNPSSSILTSCFLFGGERPATIVRPMVDETGQTLYFKTGKKKGQMKTKSSREKLKIKGLNLPKLRVGTSGVPSTDDKVLKELADMSEGQTKKFLELLLQHRGLEKLITTYYYSEDAKGKASGNLTGLHPNGYLHPTFNTTTTRTGRLSGGRDKKVSSGSGLNSQNFDVSFLDFIASRYGEQGRIIEADFSQLEVFVAAILSDDKVLLEELDHGIDLHIKSACFIYEKDEATFKKELEANNQEYVKMRKFAKFRTFELLYGAFFTDPLEKKFADYFYNKYTGIAAWHKKIEETVSRWARPTEMPLPVKDKKEKRTIFYEGLNLKQGCYKTFTNKRYMHYNKAVLSKTGKPWEYWHTPDLKDHPVQGTAADIVATLGGHLFQQLLKQDLKAHLINEVHDSFIFDVHEDDLDKTKEIIKNCLTDMEYLYKIYNKRFPISLQIDMKVGRTWGDAKRN